VTPFGYSAMGHSFGYGQQPTGSRESVIRRMRNWRRSHRAIPCTDHTPRAVSKNVTPRSNAARNQVVIASKYGFKFENGAPTASTAGPIHQAVADVSLRRLRRDVIDFFYQHGVDPQLPIEDVADAVKDLIQQGRSFTLASPMQAPKHPSRARSPTAHCRPERILRLDQRSRSGSAPPWGIGDWLRTVESSGPGLQDPSACIPMP
jgi:hypothetical protein